jgi:hypothetical protein
LINYLTNPENLQVVLYKNPTNKFSKGDLVIDLSPLAKLNAPKIGHKKDSETAIPNKWQSADGKLIYWDCPGFDDTKGPEQDIPNAFYIKRIFDTAKNVKLVLVIDDNDLNGPRANYVKKLADTLGALFDQNNLTQVMNGLSLVVTKAANKVEVDDIKGKISEMLQADCFKEYSKGKELLLSLILPNADTQLFNDLMHEFFADDQEIKARLEPLLCLKDKIALFKKPEQQGPLIEGLNAELLGGNAPILEIIAGTKFIDEPKVNVVVSDSSKLYISHLAEKAKDPLEKEIKTLRIKVDESYHLKCSELKGNKNLKDLKKLQDKLLTSLKKIIGSDINSIEKNITAFADMLALEFISEQFPTEALLNNLQYLKFFKQVKNDINLDVAHWVEELIPVRDKVVKYTYLAEQKTVQIKGKVITSDDIKSGITDDCLEQLKAVEVYATERLELSSDLNHDKLKGINFSIIAPCWVIIGEQNKLDKIILLNQACQENTSRSLPKEFNQLIGVYLDQRVIDLSGINGPSYAQQKADNGEKVEGSNPDGSGKNGNKGIDGLPGLPGGHGGNFFGAGEEFTNMEYLIINVSGGQGGPGQDGGDGSKGTKATKHGSKELVQERALVTLKWVKHISGEGIEWVKFLESYESFGKAGGKGGDGGAPGIGGRGGLAGIAKLCFPDSSQLNILAMQEEKREGIAGKPGTLGHGSYSGNVYYGEYVNSKVNFTAVTAGSLVGLGGAGLLAWGAGVGIGILITVLTGGAALPPLMLGGIMAGVGGPLLAGGTGLQLIYDRYLHSGWQGKIKSRKDKAEDGKVTLEPNSKGIKNPTPTSQESLINDDHLLKQYEEFLDLIGIVDKDFLNKVAIGLSDNEPVHTMQESILILAQDKLESVKEDMVEDAIPPILESQPMDIAGAVLDPTRNAFNQKNDPHYFYQAADIRMIQSHLQKEFGDKLLIAEPSGGNQPIDDLLASFMQSLVFDRPMLCAVNHDNWHWVVTGITRQGTSIVMFNKDSIPNKKAQQGKIGANLPENLTLTLLTNNQSEQTEGVDCGIFVLENMRIMARELIANPQAFIEVFSTYSNFCTLNKAQQLRSEEFAKAYVKGVCGEIVNEKQKHSILTKIRENHQQELFSIRETLEKLSIDGSRIIILGANDILEKKSQLLITPEGKKDISQTIGLEVAIQAFNQQHKIYSYCYKMTWTIDLDWGGNIKFPVIEKLSKDINFTPTEDFQNKLITFTPENCFGKYNFDLPLPKISFAEVCTTLCINQDQELQNEAAVIFEEFMHELTKEQVVVSGGIVDSNVL